MASGSGAEGIRQQIAAFNEEFPDITVELQLTPWADYWTKLQTAVAGGEAFDVFWLNSANCPVYASAGALVFLFCATAFGTVLVRWLTQFAPSYALGR